MAPLSKPFLQDEEFIRKNSLQCTLWIQLSEDESRILILDPKNKIQWMEENQSKSIFSGDWIFSNLRFAETTIIISPDSFTFLPLEFKDKKDTSTIRTFLINDGEVLESEIENTTISTYFNISSKLSELKENTIDLQIIPSTNLLIQHALTLATDDDELICINKHASFFELVYIKDKKIIFYNRYSNTTADDFNFYILSIFEQFSIQPAETFFYFTGNIEEEDEVYKRAAKYSSKLNFLSKSNDKADHQFFLLKQLSQCE